ncbi:MAG: hypothetical protein HXY37_16265 [Chloroflexi bacterium]|nr:hypothetical protein [Chloroflexota bacterium]
MDIEKLIRYVEPAVGLIPFPIADFGLQIAAHGVTMSDDGNDNAELPTGFGIKPSAMECEARLLGLERINFSKTISRAWCCRRQ